VAKAKAKAQRRAGPRPRVSAPTRTRQRRIGWLAWLAVGLLAAAGAFWVAKEQATGGGEAVAPPARGLPHTPDYHSLLVDPANANRVLLGTHVGVYESTDGGESWTFLGLEGKDAMHFAREDDGTVWAAGHGVLERSEDGGRTWTEVRPKGLPGLDIHGFAISFHIIYAAVAGEGLYRSDNEGKSFRLISDEVGPGVTALTVTRDGVLLAADAERGVVVNADGDGGEWIEALEMETIGLAANFEDPPASRVLAAGRAIQLLPDRNPGRWIEVLAVDEGVGPVAFAPSDPEIAYAVGFDRKLYRSEDGGRTWAAVA
jgi:hypothetical protein